jgi:hypothetical protein
MLATPEDGTAGTTSFASLPDAVAVAMKQWRAQHLASIVEAVHFFFLANLLLKCSEYFASISILLVTEKFLAAIPYGYGQKTSERVLPH